ncbi:MAG: DUF1573 domain-containing protein [Bacteroidetes bacterium]|nr:DUF1573 domain-containing protein [Bacteroidota bacterium]
MSAKPKASFESKKHDFGQKEFRSLVQHDFVLTNTGNAPLIITGHYTSCPCSQLFYSKAPVMPGAKATITLKYDSTKKGKFYRKIDLLTNAGKHTLIIKGEIIEAKTKRDPITGEELN